MNWRLLLLPFSWLFGTVTFLRRWLYEKGVLSSEKSSVATICVGNLKVGGTGKTPHIEYLIRLLRKDFSVAVLSRGYGRESKGYLLVNDLPDNQLNALQIGDEPMQLFQKFPDVKIALSEKRALGVRSLRKQFPDLDVILLDDGFQHLSFSPSLKMILTEFADPYFKDYPLPAGNLREFPFASKSADAVIVTKCPTSIDENDREHYKRKLKITPKQHAFFSSIIYKYSIEDKLRGNIMNLDQDTSVFLLTGIANPKPLLREVAKHFNSVTLLQYPDHHFYIKKDIDAIKKTFTQQNPLKTVIITTEKDQSRLLSSEDGRKLFEEVPVFVLDIEVTFLFEEELLFNQIIIDHVREKCESRKNQKDS